MNLVEWIDSSRDQHLAELYEFLRIPSISARASTSRTSNAALAGLPTTCEPQDSRPWKLFPRTCILWFMPNLWILPGNQRFSFTAITTCNHPNRWIFGPLLRLNPRFATATSLAVEPLTTRARFIFT